MIHFVEGMQRGYAYGLHHDDRTVLEEYVHVEDWTHAGIERAYRAANAGASGLVETWGRRPDLIRKRIETFARR